MSIEKIKKYDLFNELLVKILPIEEKYLNRKILSDNIKLRININDISRELKDQWAQLLGNSQDFNEIQTNYIQSYSPWKKKYDAFQDAIKNSKMSEFIQEHFSTWERLKFESNQISVEEIRKILDIVKPNIKSFQKASSWGRLNFILFRDNSFQIVLHIRLEKYQTETFSLEIIFSFWLQNREFLAPLTLESITSNYKNQMVAYNVIKKLRSLGYIEDSLFYKEEQKSMFRTNVDNLLSKPHPFTCAILKILNDNPIALFNELTQSLYEINEVIAEIMNNDDYSPQKYLDNLPKELKTFLLKGRELLSKVEDVFSIRTLKIKETKKKGKIMEVDDKLEEILGIFKDALEKDKKGDEIIPNNKGYRSINEIASEYKSMLKYSSQTYYTYFKKTDLSPYLEFRDNSGTGGGKEYRYREIFTTPESVAILEEATIEKMDDISFLSEKIKIQEAIYDYKNKDYEDSINLFENVLRKPSNQLKEDQDLFFVCLYYLGRSFFKRKNYKKALQYFKMIMGFKKSLINVNYYLAECERFLGNNLDAIKIITNTISVIQDLLKEYFPAFDPRIIFRGRFKESDLKNLHPDLLEKRIFPDFLIFYFKKIKNIHIEVYREEFEEQRINLGKNIVAVRTLYKILSKSLFLKMELLRRSIFQSIVENNEERLKVNVNQLIDYIKSFRQIPNFKRNFNTQFDGYLLYLSNISKIFKKPFIRQVIEENLDVPKGFSLLTADKAYYSITSFLNNYNQLIRWLDEMPRRIFHIDGPITQFLGGFYQGEPILKAEYLYTQAYLNYEYTIHKIIEEQNREELIDIHILHDYYGYPLVNPDSYINISKKAYKFCKKYDFKALERLSYKIVKDAKEKSTRIKELLLKRRILSINHYFRDLHNSFNAKELKNLEINFEKEPEETDFKWFFHSEILDKIRSIIRDHFYNLKITIKMFNAEVLDDLIEEIKKNHHFIKQELYIIEYIFYLDLAFNKLEKTLIIEAGCMINLDKEDYNFWGNLDRITMGIFKILEYGIAKFKIKLREDELEKYDQYFKDQFQTDFENNFFRFDVQKTSQRGVYEVKVFKLKL